MNSSIKMKSKNNSKSMILIFIGIVIFITTPTYLNELPIIGITAIIIGFIIGFIGFYHKFNNKQQQPKSIINQENQRQLCGKLIMLKVKMSEFNITNTIFHYKNKILN